MKNFQPVMKSFFILAIFGAATLLSSAAHAQEQAIETYGRGWVDATGANLSSFVAYTFDAYESGSGSYGNNYATRSFFAYQLPPAPVVGQKVIAARLHIATGGASRINLRLLFRPVLSHVGYAPRTFPG